MPNRARCTLIHNYLELGKICVSNVPRKIRTPIYRSRIPPLYRKARYFTPNKGIYS